MALQAALLRGVNVGGNRKILMADLRAWAEGLGFTSVQTLLASGNLVLDGGKLDGAALEKALETEAEKVLGLSTDFLVRNFKELKAVIAANPFPAMAKDDPSHLLVHFLRAPPPAGAVDALQAAIPGPEQVAAHGRHVYITYPAGVGHSTMPGGLIAKHLGKTDATGRNWNTVLKLAAMLES